MWAADGAEKPDPDDWLHDEGKGRLAEPSGAVVTSRGFMNIGCLVLLVLAILMLL